MYVFESNIPDVPRWVCYIYVLFITDQYKKKYWAGYIGHCRINLRIGRRFEDWTSIRDLHIYSPKFIKGYLIQEIDNLVMVHISMYSRCRYLLRTCKRNLATAHQFIESASSSVFRLLTKRDLHKVHKSVYCISLTV